MKPLVLLFVSLVVDHDVSVRERNTDSFQDDFRHRQVARPGRA